MRFQDIKLVDVPGFHAYTMLWLDISRTSMSSISWNFLSVTLVICSNNHKKTQGKKYETINDCDYITYHPHARLEL